MVHPLPLTKHLCPSSLKMGPGDSARSHTADEYILIEEIREGIALYINLLNQVLVKLWQSSFLKQCSPPCRHCLFCLN